jgi:hypothetical protein
VSPRAAGEGASIERNAGALTRAKGATSPEGRGNRFSLHFEASRIQPPFDAGAPFREGVVVGYDHHRAWVLY